MNNRFIALTDNTLRNFAVFGSQGVAVYLQFFWTIFTYLLAIAVSWHVTLD